MSEEEKEAIENLIKDYEICIKEAEYEGNVEQKEGLTEVKEILKNALNLISNLQKENKEIRQWKYVIDTYEDLDKLKELDEIFIKGKKYIAEESLTKERQKRIKLDKVIEEMGIALMHNKNSRFYNMTLAEVEQYFYKKVEDKDE